MECFDFDEREEGNFQKSFMFSFVQMVSRKMKGGSVDWTVGKLMAIVLAVVLLVIVVFGWSNLIVPLYERAEGKVNEVLILLHVRDEAGGSVECIEKGEMTIVGVGVGDVRVCRDGCEVVLGEKLEDYIKFSDLNSNRFKYIRKDGSLKDGGVKDNGEWYSFDQSYLGLDVEKVEKYRGVYFEMNKTLLENVFGGDLEKFESFMEFNPGDVLQFRHRVMGYQQTYSWDDGKWDWFGKMALG